MLEEDWKPVGWLGVVVAGLLWVRLDQDCSEEQVIKAQDKWRAICDTCSFSSSDRRLTDCCPAFAPWTAGAGVADLQAGQDGRPGGC
jgi:hypothetical protein